MVNFIGIQKFAISMQTPLTRALNCCFATSCINDSHDNPALPSSPNPKPLHHLLQGLSRRVLAAAAVPTTRLHAFRNPCFPAKLDLQSTECDSEYGLENPINYRASSLTVCSCKGSRASFRSCALSSDVSQHDVLSYHLPWLQKLEARLTLSIPRSCAG